MILEKIKEQTRASHQALEGKIIPVIKGMEEQADYIRLLQLFYGYMKPIEEKITTYVNREIFSDYEERRKAARIAEDIRYVAGAEQPALPVCRDLPEIENEQQAAGALYVLEGSTLGGAVIKDMIQKRLNIAPAAITFFDGYGAETQTMWQRFRDALKTYGTDAGEAEVIAAAENTFVKFKNWIDAN